MSYTEQGKNFMNSLKKYINSVEDSLSDLQEPLQNKKKRCWNKSKFNKGPINCGGHRANKCKNCIYNKKGKKIGKNWCNGDCSWNGNRCVKKTKLDILSSNFNKDLLQYTKAFNQYNEQLISSNYPTPGSTAYLLKTNNDLTQSAENIYNSINEMSVKDKRLNAKLKEKKKKLLKSILKLKEQQKKLNSTRFNNNTLDASFYDNKRLSESINLRYMLLLLGVIILFTTIYKLNTTNNLDTFILNNKKLVIFLIGSILLYMGVNEINYNKVPRIIYGGKDINYIKYLLLSGGILLVYILTKVF